MKRTIVGLICFAGTGLLVHAQAPQSLAGFTMCAYVLPVEDLFVSDSQYVIDFFGNGTFTVRLAATGELPPLETPINSYAYLAPFSGTYQYQVTSPTTAVLKLTPSVFNNGLNIVTFYTGSLGAVASTSNPFPAQEQVFVSLTPSGENFPRALVNVSMLINAKAGEATTIGFVIAGSTVTVAGQQLEDYREILVRAVGPSLAQFGIAGYAPNPTYSLPHAPHIPHYNQSWSATPASATTIAAEGSRAGAFPLIQGSNDKADIFLLSPGAYTITVAPSTSDQVGAELVEVYEIQ